MENIVDMNAISVLEYNCRFCKYTTRSKRSLSTHESIHFRDRSYKCPHCEMLFREKQHLHSHLYTHDSARHFKCAVCGRTFRHSSSLARHKRSHRFPNQKYNARMQF